MNPSRKLLWIFAKGEVVVWIDHEKGKSTPLPQRVLDALA